MSKAISLIAAMDRTRAIGRGNDIPWRIPGEQRRFKDLTMGNALIMGRKTYDSIGRPLPGRHCIILSQCQGLEIPGVMVVSSVPEALEAAEQLSGSEIFVGGGEEIYRLFLPLAQRIYLTEIHANFGGDRHFPVIDSNEFTLLGAEEIQGEVPYTCGTYERR
jgi:dihydrofolate reductase